MLVYVSVGLSECGDTDTDTDGGWHCRDGVLRAAVHHRGQCAAPAAAVGAGPRAQGGQHCSYILLRPAAVLQLHVRLRRVQHHPPRRSPRCTHRQVRPSRMQC